VAQILSTPQTFFLYAVGIATALTSNCFEIVMEYLQAVILGIVQGVTEFLPISSTAHLIIFRDVFEWGAVECSAQALQNGCVARVGWTKAALDGIQFGSVIAVVIYFWNDIRKLLSGSIAAIAGRDWQREEWKILVGIALGSIPALVGAYLLKKNNVNLENPQMIGTMSIIMALLLGVAENYGKRLRGFSKLRISDGLLVGLGQTIALLPGASRSGSTLTTALLIGLERQTAARFSFLLGLPVLTLATLVQTKDVLAETTMRWPMLAGITATAVFSYLSIAWLMKFLQRQSTWVFVFYRLAFGMALLLAILSGWKPPGAL
jgi:undecaprenyl-diphosphatase